MWRGVDLVLRLAYVALVPFALPFINLFMPITGLLIGTALATAIALVGSDVWRAKVESIRFIGRFLGGMGRLGDFYRRFPPKPLVFYLLYPLLLPAVLVMRVPRHELFLYRKMNAIALVVIASTGAYDYFVHWRPELTFAQFASATGAVLVMQLIVTCLLIMPLVTTLVLLRERGRHRTLTVLVIVMVATGVWGAWDARRVRTMPFTTWLRLEERTRYARVNLIACEMMRPGYLETCLGHDPELRALLHAVKAATTQTSYHDMLAAAREQLASFYKPDEADAFRIARLQDVLVVYAKYGHKPAIWLGYANHHYLIYPQQLPAQLRTNLDL